jgi:hypothetical protein
VNGDVSVKLISFDFLDSIHAWLSTAAVGIEVHAPLDRFSEMLALDLAESRRYSVSGHLSVSSKLKDGIGLIETNGVGLSTECDPWLDKAEELTTAWIGLASTLMAVLLLIAGLFVLLGRRLSLLSLTSLPKSKMEWGVHGQPVFVRRARSLSQRAKCAECWWSA